MKQHLEIVITCKFSTFAQFYTGLTDKIEIIDELFMGGCLWTSSGSILPRQKMFRLWDDEEYVDIRFEHDNSDCEWQASFQASDGTHFTALVFGAKELLDDIINFAFDE